MYLIVDGENRRVVLGDDWSALEIYGRGEFPLHKLSSIQLETVWTSFDATLVFEGESGGGNDEAPHQPLHFRFAQFDVRVRFILTAKVLRNLAKRLQQRTSRKGPSQHSHLPTNRGGARRQHQQQQQQQQRRQPQQRSSQSPENGGRPSRQNQTFQAEASAAGPREDPPPRAAQQEHLPTKGVVLSPGVAVRFSGLKSMPALNGNLGVCERLDDDTGRWHVRMRASDEVKSVKPENLVALANHEEESTCIICLSSLASMAFVPCGHRCLCPTCAEELTGDLRRRCPQCRQPSNSIIRIFC